MTPGPWMRPSCARSRVCVTACRARGDGWKWMWCPVRATGSGLTSRDPEQNRDELVDLAHLVEEVIGPSLHAALAHRGQVVIRQHDDPYMATAVLGVLVAGPGLADHADATAGTQLHVHHDDVVGHRVQFL